MTTELETLNKTYHSLLKELLAEAETRNLRPIYANRNESEEEIPEGFYFGKITQRELELRENKERPWNEYYYENRLEVEAQEGVNAFSIRDSKLFQVMVYGGLDDLKELLDDPELLAEYIESIFGSYSDFLTETRVDLELGDEFTEEQREAA